MCVHNRLHIKSDDLSPRYGDILIFEIAAVGYIRFRLRQRSVGLSRSGYPKSVLNVSFLPRDAL